MDEGIEFDADWMMGFIKKICDECGDRIGGSEGEAKAGEIIEDEMNKFCDTVQRDYFKCHPKAFLDYIWVTLILYLSALLFYFYGYGYLTPLLILTGFLIYHLQQNLHYEVVDFLFPEKESFHVYGKILPKGSAEKLAMLSAHHDAAYEFPLLGKYRKKGVYFVVLTIFVILANFVLSALVIILQFADVKLMAQVDFFLKPLLLLGAILLLTVSATLRSGRVVPGANDNLSSLAAIMEAGKYIAENRPERTEVWIISFAGEEHMRGSKRFVEKHFDELKRRRAVLLNFECVSSKYFLLATEEKMYRVKHSKRAVEIARSAAERERIDVKVAPLPFAGSDAANFSRKGLDAAVIFGLEDDGIPRYWHTLEDTPDKLEKDKLIKAARIARSFVYEVDEKW